MDLQRRRYRNNIHLQISTSENIIKRSNDTITRLKYSEYITEYVKIQIDNLRKIIEDKTELVEKLRYDLSELDRGLKDVDIKEEQLENNRKLKIKEDERLFLKGEKKKYKEENKEKSKKYWKKIVSDARSNRQNKRDIRYCYKHYNRAVDSLPNYMKNNLSEMPNNKGYIWRGVYFYGDLSYNERQPRLLFEKMKGVMYIHEYTERGGGVVYKKFEKIGKNRKTQVYQLFKKKKKVGGGISF